jgi:hypothetical protein
MTEPALSEPQRMPGTPNVDELEVVEGVKREQLQGWIPQLAGEDEVRSALDKAFEYRGDVTITLRSGVVVEGYVFDRRQGETLADSLVRLYPRDRDEKVAISYAEISALVFSGRDTAAGKSWEAWVRKYQEKRQAGEKNIGLEPEALE